MEAFFNIKNFENRKKVMKPFFSIKNFKSRKKVMESFFSINNFKSRKAVMEFFLSFRNFKSRKKMTEFFFSGHTSLSFQISRKNIFFVSSHWISLTIHFLLWIYFFLTIFIWRHLISMKKDAEHISVNAVTATFLLHI